jgi:hypothetical protein
MKSITINNAPAFVFMVAALSFCTALLCVVAVLLFLGRSDVARPVPSSPLQIIKLLHFLFAQKWSGFCSGKVYQGIQYNKHFHHNTGTDVLPQCSAYEWI